ncbi:MAG: hypothetical protein LBH37_02025 [Oscillospiraceae bacterium]|jgi:lipopolysaccharide biosynthesis glycosyltransferase|nr:hypothetical protein [Oscillospiraceae bacterium]
MLKKVTPIDFKAKFHKVMATCLLFVVLLCGGFFCEQKDPQISAGATSSDYHIVLCIDDGYAPYALNLITSMLYFAPSNVVLNFHFLVSPQFTSHECIFSIHNLYPNRCVTNFVDMGNLCEGFGDSKFPKESYYRLFASWVLPKHIKRFLYVDSDAIVNSREFLNIFKYKLNDNQFVAGVRDPISVFQDHSFPYETPGLTVGDMSFYINSGVLLFNAEACRKYKVVSQFESYLNKFKDFKPHDQAAINFVCRENHILHLPPCFNLLSFLTGNENGEYMARIMYGNDWDTTKKNPYFIHFADAKPFKLPGVNYGEFFWLFGQHCPYLNTPSHKELFESYKGKLSKLEPISLGSSSFSNNSKIRSKQGVSRSLAQKENNNMKSKISDEDNKISTDELDSGVNNQCLLKSIKPTELDPTRFNVSPSLAPASPAADISPRIQRRPFKLQKSAPLPKVETEMGTEEKKEDKKEEKSKEDEKTEPIAAPVNSMNLTKKEEPAKAESSEEFPLWLVLVPGAVSTPVLLWAAWKFLLKGKVF